MNPRPGVLYARAHGAAEATLWGLGAAMVLALSAGRLPQFRLDGSWAPGRLLAALAVVVAALLATTLIGVDDAWERTSPRPRVRPRAGHALALAAGTSLAPALSAVGRGGEASWSWAWVAWGARGALGAVGLVLLGAVVLGARLAALPGAVWAVTLLVGTGRHAAAPLWEWPAHAPGSWQAWVVAVGWCMVGVCAYARFGAADARR